MKLLLVTQRIDRGDPVLGFFHRWIEEFAGAAEHVVALGQAVGTHAFPANVQVASLGKERGTSRPAQVLAFWRTIIARRKQYDVVLVHMTPIWIVLGAPFFLLLRKRMYLWYEARGARWPLRIALLFVRYVFSASPSGMPLTSRKSIVTGHGIDTEAFSPADVPRDESAVITVGRITEAKRVPLILDAFAALPENSSLLLVGIPVTEDDRRLARELDALIAAKHLGNRVRRESLPHEEVIAALRRSGLFLHASATALDKAVLEAMACECLVVSTSDALREVLPSRCHASPDSFADVATSLLSLSAEEKAALRHELRERVVRDHSLERLIVTLVSRMT